MAEIRTTPSGLRVQAHVQAFADRAAAESTVRSFSTYRGHQPSHDLALDCWPATQADGDVFAAWVVEHIEELAVDYVIWRRRIYNPEIAKRWRPMADRGSRTANHEDHIHVSFEPQAHPEEDDMFTETDRQLLADLQAAMSERKEGTFPDAVVTKAVDQVVEKLSGAISEAVAEVMAVLEDHANGRPRGRVSVRGELEIGGDDK